MYVGLVCTYQWVENAVFSILITHISDGWSHPDLSKAAIIVNIREGVCQVLQIFFAYIAHVYSGLFRMLLFSTFVYDIGLWLFFMASRGEENLLDHGIFYTALVLLTLSEAAIKVTLYEFLQDQVSKTVQQITDQSEEEKRACTGSRGNFWWISASVLAATVAATSGINSFEMLSMVSAIAMWIAFIWFLLGKTSYKVVYNRPADDPLRDALLVIYTAINAERGESYTDQPISPHVSWLRWLDRAAIAVQDEEVHDEKVKEVKFLLKMLPMWMTFITFSVVEATGNTFFLEEATYNNDEFLILFFIIVERFTRFVAEQILDYLLEKYFKKKKTINVQKVMLARIGVGMICCVLCCIAAWTNAARRYRNPKRGMSTFMLTPQFVLLGLMTGLAEDGLQSFFESQVSESISRYGPQFGEFVRGLGKFLSVGFIVVFKKNWFRWLKDDIRSSRLDKYYAVLAVLSMLNFIIYCLVAYWYGDDTFLSEDHRVDTDGGLLEDSQITQSPPIATSMPRRPTIPLQQASSFPQSNWRTVRRRSLSMR